MIAFISKIVKAYTQKELRLHSSSAAFYIVVSALPLVAILIYTLSFFSPDLITELEGLLKAILPKDFYGDLRVIIAAIRNNRLPALVPVSIFAALWGSTKGIGGLCNGVEAIYGTKKQMGLIFRWVKTLWRTVAFYLIIIGSLLIFALGKLIYTTSLFVSLLLNLRVLLFALALSLFFAFFYSRLANTPIKNHFAGGALAAIGWMLFTFLYSIYVSLALDYASIYAEMGTAIFFMLWVYFCVNIILAGAQINKSLS